MTLNISLSGCKQKIEEFIQFLRKSPKYSACAHIKKDEISTDIVFAEPRKQAMFPTIRDIKTVQIETADHQHIQIILLDAEIVDMTDHITIVHGKSYDVYSSPEDK
jgi:hypothetical protein